MIRLFSVLCKYFNKNKINLNSDIDIFDTYISNINVCLLVCPKCTAKGTFKYLAKYTRHLVTYFKGVIRDNLVEVPRYKCESCNSSHAILPPVIIPYKSFGFSFLISLVHDYIVKKFKSVQILCDNYSISIPTLYRLLKIFKLHKRLWLGLLQDSLESNNEFIKKFNISFNLENESLIYEFFQKFILSFLQKNRKFGIP